MNPHREMIVNNAGKVDTVLSQLEQWLILSNVINYIQYDKHPKNREKLYRREKIEDKLNWILDTHQTN